MDLDGKVALVTGASRGVGAATAVAFAAAGCDVACAARSTRASPGRLAGTLDDTVARIEVLGRSGLAVPTDLADEASVVQMVRDTIGHFGRLDVLVNNAAIVYLGGYDMPLELFDRVVAVNLRAPLVAMREAIPAMRDQRSGAIVNVSSAIALMYVPNLMAYGTAKVALERLTVDIAQQLLPFGITANLFRIDLPCDSEGYRANAPDADTDSWEPCDVPAEGIVWVARQGVEMTGRRLSMRRLREEEQIMVSRAPRGNEQPVCPTELQDGVIEIESYMEDFDVSTQRS